jgi:hypothetical protein
VSGSPGFLQHDDARHGVARYARELAHRIALVVGHDLGVNESGWTGGGAPSRVHGQFTDRLWARSPEEAADRFVALAEGRRVGVTLHDVPQPSDGHAFERRIAAYGRVVAVAQLVVVNSRHELSLLESIGIDPSGVAVIPLPVTAPAAGAVPLPGSFDPVAAVLGYIYPGKGHRETIEAVAASGATLSMRALGAPSPGHEADVRDLEALGRALGVEVLVTGYLDDEGLAVAATRVAVPVVAHQHFSASGSINSWISAGRRPLVVRTRYTEEMAALRPGTLRLVDAGGLAAAIAAAAADPLSTVLAPDAVTVPHLEDTARAYLEAWGVES